MSELQQRIARLSPEQRDALLRRLAKKPSAPPPAVASTPVDQAAVVLSFAQERMYFHNELVPGDSAHNIAGTLRFHGALSRQALSAAFDSVVERHETLRANFQVVAGELRQTIHPFSPLAIGFIDLSSLDSAAREAECLRMACAEASRGFDLSRDRLLRATLLRLADTEHLLLLTMHHIISDGWSVGVLLDEVGAFYAAALEGRELRRPPLPLQYREFAARERAELAGGSRESSIQYWKSKLANTPPPVRLRPDALLHDAAGDGLGLTRKLRILPALADALEGLSRRENTTLFTTLLTAFLIVLSRLAARHDLVVGSPVSGRNRLETEGLIGLFVNTVALRAAIEEDGTIRDTLASVRHAVLEALAHELPFEQVVQQVDPKRAAGARPFFDILFNFTPTPPRSLAWPSVQVTFEEPPVQGAEFPMELYITRLEATFEFKLLYATRLYSAAAIDALLSQIGAVLEQMVRNPDGRVRDLDLLTEGERAWRPDPTAPLDASRPLTVPAAIVQWIARAPDLPALEAPGRTLTYAQLGAAIESVAAQLRAAGMGPGHRVAVFGPRGIDVVVSMTAVLFAGGVLLNLSPDLPELRRRMMLEETGTHFLLCCDGSEETRRWTSELSGIIVLCASCGGVTAGPSPTEYAAVNDEAYIFFTSGSTGKPKAILGAHAGLGHFLSWQREAFRVAPGDRCAHLTGLSFDVVLRDVFLALTSGATLVIPAEADLAGTGATTLQWLQRERISILHTVPSVADLWLLRPPPGLALPSLRLVFFAGEPLTSSLIARWRAAFYTSTQLVNLYGPTETTLAKCFYRVPEAPLEGIQPLGLPLPQTQILVLTSSRRLCAIGEPGEIAIRTPFRTRGYLNAPEETSRRFIPNPFTGNPGDLVYLTGDTGFLRADGLLEFLGRCDHQVKIRGVRVEPGEVAAMLRQSSGVAAAAVISYEGPAGAALAAYLVMADGEARDPAPLRDFLRQRLPPAMLPSAFVFLDTLPLTANHKLDRQRLPSPLPAVIECEAGYDPPRNALELQLAQIWEDLLGVRPISVTRSFFDLGGHSLLAMRLLMNVEHTLERRIPMADFLAQPTIRNLAASSTSRAEPWPPIIKLWSSEAREILFVMHSGGGTLFNYVNLIRHLAPPVQVYGLQSRGLDGSDPHTGIEEMAAAYAGLMRTVQPHGPYLVAGHSLGGILAFEVARQLTQEGEKVDLAAIFDPPPPGPEPALAEESEQDEETRLLAGLMDTLGRFAGEDGSSAAATLAALPAAARLQAAVEAMRRAGILPPAELHPLILNMLRIVKAHTRARRRYSPVPAAVPITLFKAASQSAQGNFSWADLSTLPAKVIDVPGDHVTMLAEPHVRTLAQKVRECLAEAIALSSLW